MPRPGNSKDKKKQLSAIYPIRNLLHWEIRDGIAVITYKKEFRAFERFLYKRIGGSKYIRRPLDEMGTRIWLLCDGRRDLAEICGIMDMEFKERIEPVFKRVWGLIEILIRIGLMRLESGPRGRLPQRVPLKNPNPDAESP